MESIPTHRVFISYYHNDDQNYKDHLVLSTLFHNTFADCSVDTGNIDEARFSTDEAIRQEIRDNYLKDSSVTIVLVGKNTKTRKFVDWEIYSSMYDGKVNKKSGILVINLPGVGNGLMAHSPEEKQLVAPFFSSWRSVTTRSEYEETYPYMPVRLIDNFLAGVCITVVNWNTIYSNADVLKQLIHNAYLYRTQNNYDLSRPMRRNNS